MTRDLTARCGRLEIGMLRAADCLRVGTAGVERAARWERRRARDVPLQEGLGGSPTRGWDRDRSEKRLCVGWSGRSNRPSTDDNSTISPRYMTATRSLMCRMTARSWATITRVGPAVLEFFEEIDDLCLDGDVEG